MDARIEQGLLDGDEPVVGEQAAEDVGLDAAFGLVEDWPGGDFMLRKAFSTRVSSM